MLETYRVNHINEIAFDRNNARYILDHVDKLEYPIVHIKDFKMRNLSGPDQSKKKYYKGNYFLLDFNGAQYFHTTFDIIGQYLVLQDYIPNLKAVDITSSNMGTRKTYDKFRKNLITSFELGSGDKMDSAMFDCYEATFENIYYVQGISHIIFLNHVPVSKIHWAPYEKYSPGRRDQDGGGYCHQIAHKLHNFFKLDYKEDRPEKKIFLSRKAVSLYTQNYKSSMHEYVWRSRYYPYEYHQEVEKYFEHHGYEILDMEDYSVKEQAKMISEATHIAGIHGANFTNMLWVSPGTKVFAVNSHNDYEFIYDKIAYQFGVTDFVKIMETNWGRHTSTVKYFDPGDIVQYIKFHNIEL